MTCINIKNKEILNNKCNIINNNKYIDLEVEIINDKIMKDKKIIKKMDKAYKKGNYFEYDRLVILYNFKKKRNYYLNMISESPLLIK